MMRLMLALATVSIVLSSAGAALAFGTIHGLGQDAEHERITRHALSCPEAGADCLQPKSLDELAGKRGTFGAVGTPDRGALILESKAHCDRGDYLDVPGYPQSADAARAALEACRTWMRSKLEEAVSDAAGLLDGQGRLRPGQLGMPCVFFGRIKGRAKCNVLEDFGILLHASQDFYSHSNWVDRPAPDRPVGLDNPPGLGQTEPAPWISLTEEPPFPPGLISGCYATPEAIGCKGRVRHSALNKDTGPIDPEPGQGTSPRGAVEGNFRRAVEAAVADTRDKWLLLKQRLSATYGPVRGARMTCALASDDPVRSC